MYFRAVSKRCSVKLQTLFKTKKYYNTAELVRLYKCHVVPVLEFSTPAVYHAATKNLDLLDRVQKRFLKEVGLTEEEALTNYNLAPLNCRRDMAALGLVHRTALGQGPKHFRDWFFATAVPQHTYKTRYQKHRHNKQLHDHLQGNHTELLRRSLLGVPRVYNGLPQDTVNSTSVKLFQRKLQRNLKEFAKTGRENWQRTLTARLR